MSQLAFSSIKLSPALQTNIEALGYTGMTPIQAQSLPPILEGKDVLAQGKTGSGKTAAFTLGLLEKLDVKLLKVQSLVLCPTRELADQVAGEIRKLARTIPNVKVLTMCGGMPFRPQAESLEHGAHIIVGTPGRVEDHLRKGTLKLDQLNTLVLDEVDRMLDMGFQDALDAIVDEIPTQRQTLLFSATISDSIRWISRRIMSSPVEVIIKETHDDSTIQQYLYRLSDNQDRLTGLRLLLMHFQPESAVVFCKTKQETQEVADALKKQGFCVVVLHGNLEQRERDQTLIQFANKSASILVATDVAARGLDIEDLDAVINYQLANDPESHVHRIGRTGRAGSKGIACTLHYEKEQHKVAQLEVYLDKDLEVQPLPPASVLDKPSYKAVMSTLQIDGGKKQKVRPGDILGALTGENGVSGQQVGKIKIYNNWSFVAVNRDVVKAALDKLGKGKLKGRSFRVRQIR